MVLAVAAAAALVGGVAAGTTVAVLSGKDEDAPAEATAATGASRLTVEQNSAVADAAEKGRASVVRIESTRRTVAWLFQ